MRKTIYGLNARTTEVSLNLVSTYITRTGDNYRNFFTAYKSKNLPQKEQFVGVVHTLSGYGEITTVNGKLSLATEDLVFIKHAETVSFISTGEDWHFLCTWFYVKGLPLEFDKPFKVKILENERDIYMQMIELLNQDDQLSLIKANAICTQLVTDYIKITQVDNTKIPYKDALDKIAKYIHDNLEQPLKVTDLAALCGFCKNHFCALFKNYFEISPKQYVINVKLKEAAFLLLNSNSSVEEISSRLSFFSPSQFISCFRKHYGMTPAQFRKNSALAYLK